MNAGSALGSFESIYCFLFFRENFEPKTGLMICLFEKFLSVPSFPNGASGDGENLIRLLEVYDGAELFQRLDCAPDWLLFQEACLIKPFSHLRED